MNPISLKTIWAAFANAWDVRDRRVGYVIGTGASTSMAPSVHGAGSLQVDIAAGNYSKNGADSSTAYAGGNITLTAADSTNPRVDIVFMNSGGTLAKTDGTAAPIVVGVSGPVPPAWPAGCCPLAICLVPATATDFTTGGYVFDCRPFGVVPATFTSPLTTKGDLYTYSSADARLAVGANGRILTASSGATTGNAWGQGPLTTDGDLMLGATAGTPTRLAVGATAGMYPRSNGTTLAYSLGPLTTTGDLLVGATGAEPTRLPIGSNATVLTSNGSTASWAAPAAPSLTSSNNTISSAVNVSNGTWTDACSLSLTAGTWLIIAQLDWDKNGQGSSVVMGGRIQNTTDTATLSCGEYKSDANASDKTLMTMSAIVTLASTKTIKSQGIANQTGILINAANTTNGTGNFATQMNAIRIA